MKNKIIGGFIAFALLAVAAGAWAEGAKPEKKKEIVEKTGIIKIEKAEKGQKYDTVLLQVGEETIKLIPGKDKKAFKPLEMLDGKTVAVKGEYLPPAPPKHPLAAMKVESFTEVKEAAKK